MRNTFQRAALLLIFLLNACGGNEPSVTATPLPSETPVIPPTLTATPTIPLAALILPSNLDPETSNLYQTTVYDLTQSSGYRFQTRDSITEADLTEPGLKIVIALPPDPGIAALAAAAPQVQFLSINIPGVLPGGNVSALGGEGQTGIAAFLAGYTAALLTEDYRIGMIVPKGNADAQQAETAFRNGMAFHCGLCRPIFFPSFCLVENLQSCYPQYVEIPTDEDPARYGPYADYLILQREVDTLFVYPAVADPDLLTYIGTTGALLIGASTPDERPGGWVMTIQPDVIKAIQNAWPQLVAGQGGVTVQSPLGLGDVDPSLLSPGKQKDVQEILNKLQQGLININNP
ncbi:MAG TPA: hypothetical protein PLA27_11075 [Anaerolineales bacterium]|nr:hypothetical protein [Anaerolineales bacterium]